MIPPVLISVAHSRKSPGVVNGTQLEHDISRVASASAIDVLSAAGVPALVTECAQLVDSDYSIIKPAFANSYPFSLAVEIHCNGAISPSAGYGEAIYYPGSTDGQASAKAICAALKTTWAPMGWIVTGARANDPAVDLHYDFFLSKLNPPSVIVEGLFLSNPAQAAWLALDGGEAYGQAVGQGLLSWWRARYP